MSHYGEEAKLRRFYEELSDEQLTDLAAKPEELTALAQELVHSEMQRRRLKVVPLPAATRLPGFDEIDFGSPAQPRGERQIWSAAPGDYAALPPQTASFLRQSSICMRCAWRFHLQVFRMTSFGLGVVLIFGSPF